MDSESIFAAALAHHRARRLAEAERLYGQVLAQDPTHPAALYRSGLVCLQTFRTEAAVPLMLRAIAVAGPNQLAEFHAGLAFAYRRLEAFDEAVRHYRRVLELDPGAVDAHLNLGGVLRHQGRPAEAEASYRAALALAPADAEAAHNLASVLSDQRRHDEAIMQFRRATALKPALAPAHGGLGVALKAVGDLVAAAASFRRAIAADPDLIPARNNLAITLNVLGRSGEAEACCREALRLHPDDPGLFNTLGVALMQQDRLDASADCFERALALRPDHLDARYNLGAAMKDQGKPEGAAACFRQVLQTSPDFAPARFALCMARLTPLYADEADIELGRADYRRALQDLARHAQKTGVGALAAGVGASQPFYLAYQGRDDVELQRLYGGLVCAAMAARFPAAPLPAPPAEGERLRVGFVSGFFRRHANWNMPIKGWVEQLDRRKFSVFGYHTGAIQDGETARAAAACERFVQGPLPLERWRQVIGADAPHVLIYPEVGMDPMAVQLAAQRLAPIQCNAWGHPTTSGMPTLDYYLSSELMEPPDGQDHYTEHLVRLPNLSVFCSPTPAAAAAVTRAELGLRAGAAVFWCGQSLYKYLPQFDAVFAAIAGQVPGCQFAFIEFPGSPILTERFRRRLEQAFALQGLKVDDHCRILPRLAPDRYVAAMGQADIVLDSPGWSGCNSLIDSLAYDLPIVTVPGPFMRGRHGHAILTRIGEVRTIARTVDDFASIAVRLARDADFRTDVSRRIAASKHLVFFDGACISALEDFLMRAGGGDQPTGAAFPAR